MDKKEKYEMIKQRKLKTPLTELCKGMPSEFCEFVETIRQCGFEERPDYSGLRTLFRDLFYRSGYEFDFEFDWILHRRNRAAGSSSKK